MRHPKLDVIHTFRMVVVVVIMIYQQLEAVKKGEKLCFNVYTVVVVVCNLFVNVTYCVVAAPKVMIEKMLEREELKPAPVYVSLSLEGKLIVYHSLGLQAFSNLDKVERQ